MVMLPACAAGSLTAAALPLAAFSA